MRVALYARVSTVDQTCSLQLSEMRDYCRFRKWEISGEYVDTGWSGTKASRPELDRLMADARKRAVDCIIVYKLDRWGRSVANCLSSIDELTRLGVRWMALTQNLDTDESNPGSRLMLTIFAAFAEFERSLIVDRVKSGMLAARHKGIKVGRKVVIFNRGKARAMQADGKSLRQISKALGVGKGTIERLLKAA